MRLQTLLEDRHYAHVLWVFCCSMGMGECVDLLEACKRFRESFEDLYVLEEAKSIVRLYLRKNSLHRVRIDPSLLEQVDFCIDNNELTVHTFDSVEQFITNQLQTIVVPSFLESPAYKKLQEGASLNVRLPADTTEIDQLSHYLRDAQVNLTNIHAHAQRGLECSTATARTGKMFASSMVQYSSLLGEEHPLYELFCQFGRTMESIEDSHLETTASIVSKFETPLNNMIKEELGGALAQKRKVESKHKLSESKLHHTLETMRDCSDKCELQTLRSFYDAMEDYYRFYSLAHKHMCQLLPLMADTRAAIEVMDTQPQESFIFGERFTIPEVEILMQGWLEKKGEKRRNWNTRWFVLKNHYLFYFDNQVDQNLKGAIRLKNCVIKPASNMKKPHCFSIVTSNRTYFISANTERKMNEWITAIQQATLENETLRRMAQSDSRDSPTTQQRQPDPQPLSPKPLSSLEPPTYQAPVPSKATPLPKLPIPPEKKPLPPIPGGVSSPSTELQKHKPTSLPTSPRAIQTAIQQSARGSLKNSKEGSVLVKQGYLTKKGAKRRNWATRWFILKSGVLAYHKSPSDLEPKGVIYLDGCKVQPTEELKKPFLFAISKKSNQPNDRVYYIQAKNPADFDAWINAIRSCIPD